MKALRRLFPAPFLSLALFAAWLMLSLSGSVGHLLLALLLAFVIPIAVERWQPDKANPRRPRLALGLLMRVMLDVVTANIEVARQVLGPEAKLKSGWLWVPLDLHDPHAISMLAAIITLTPGTVSSDLAEDRRHLLVHALHVEDAEALVAEIKQRYEAPLKAIFE